MKVETHFKLPKVFIVGSGRSGTTLLASMLNASDQIYIPYETDFIARAYPYLQNKTAFDVQDYKLITQLFKKTAKQEGWGMSEEYLLSHLESKSPQTFTDVNSAIYEAFHKQEGTLDLDWGIKAPVLIASLDRICEVCPGAKIVHIIRDGRDVYLSYKKIHESSEVKFGPKGVIATALYWIDGLRRIEQFKNSEKDIDIFELRYRDLLSEPEEKLRELCNFLEIGYRSEMHEKFNENPHNKKVVPSQFKQSFHKKLIGGLDPNNTEKYLSKMSESELFQFELVAAPYLVKYGYQLQYPMVKSILFAPLRSILYSFARLLNNLRYAHRDRQTYNQANRNLA